MHRTLLTRSASLLAALVLAATGWVDAWGLHPCPHHDLAIQVVQEADGGSHHGGAHHGAASSADDEGDGAHPCTCVGDCQADGRTPVLAASPAQAALRPAPVATHPESRPARDETLPGAAPHTLPFANAPPSLT